MDKGIKEIALAHDLPVDKIEQAERLLGFDPCAVVADVKQMHDKLQEITKSKDIAKTNALILCITADYAIRNEMAGEVRFSEYALVRDLAWINTLHLNKDNITIDKIWH